jgi:hypothetical protein
MWVRRRALKNLGTRSLAGALVAVLVVASACSSTGSATNGGSAGVLARPSSTGHVTIVSPVDGQVIRGDDVVSVKVDLTGATIVPAASTTIVPDEGHLHLSLDGEIAAMNFGLTDELNDVRPGIHVIQVEFVASDHLPFDPRVIDQVTFQVKR